LGEENKGQHGGHLSLSKVRTTRVSGLTHSFRRNPVRCDLFASDQNLLTARKKVIVLASQAYLLTKT